jgi:hypothetical protein
MAPRRASDALAVRLSHDDAEAENFFLLVLASRPTRKSVENAKSVSCGKRHGMQNGARKLETARGEGADSVPARGPPKNFSAFFRCIFTMCWRIRYWGACFFVNLTRIQKEIFWRPPSIFRGFFTRNIFRIFSDVCIVPGRKLR